MRFDYINQSKVGIEVGSNELGLDGKSWSIECGICLVRVIINYD